MMNNKREEIPYDEDGKQLSFNTDAETVYVDGVPLKAWLLKLKDDLSRISGGKDGSSFFGFLTDYAAVSNENNNLEYVKTITSWSSTSPTLSLALPHLWKRIQSKVQASDGSVALTDTEYQYCGSLGQSGLDAEWKEWIFRLTDNSKPEYLIANELQAELETYYNSNPNSDYQSNDYCPPYWDDDMLTVNSVNVLQWCASRYKKNGVWGKFENVHVFGRKPLDGITTNNIYTISKQIESDKWEQDKTALIASLSFNSLTGKVSNFPANTNYTWEDFVPNFEANTIIYLATAYFQGETCLNVDAPIRITGPAGPGSDGNGIEFAYCSLDKANPTEDEFPTFISSERHFDSVLGQWYDSASECPITPTNPYLFVRRRTGQYTNEYNWYWSYNGTKYGKSSTDSTVVDADLAPEDWNYGWSEPMLWSSWGVDGVDGDGVQYVFLRLTEDEYKFVTADPTRWNFDGTVVDEEEDEGLVITREQYPTTIFHASAQTGSESYFSEDIIKDWTDNPLDTSPEYPYQFCCLRFYTYTEDGKDKGWQEWSTDNIALWAHYGKDGKDGIAYQATLGNTHETIYAAEQIGLNREAYVILDGDGVTTGEISISKNSEVVPIDELCILGNTNTEHTFGADNYLRLNLGDGWNCKFQLTYNDSKPVINLVGIGDNPDDELNRKIPRTLPDTLRVSESDRVFKGNLQGKYQKKLVIKVGNSEDHISQYVTWTIDVIRDKNGDGVFRYRMLPNMDRIVKHDYYKKTYNGTLEKLNTIWNIGDAQTLSFDVEYDALGKTWSDYLNKEFYINLVKNGTTVFSKKFTNSPATFSTSELQDVLNPIVTEQEPLIAQYMLELKVEDPDYGEGFVTVDSCPLLFEYVISEAGKDGATGADGASVIFSLTNNSGSFTYDFAEKACIINEEDNSTNIQYIKDGSYICCDRIDIGNDSYTSNTSNIKVGDLTLNLTKNLSDWTLTVTEISYQEGSDKSSIPSLVHIKGYSDSKLVGESTYKMIGFEDINADGAYSYQIIPDNYFTSIDASSAEELDVTVYRKQLVKGEAYDATIDCAIRVISKKTSEQLGNIITGQVQCSSPAEIQTQVTLRTIQENKGVIVELYVADEDYEDFGEITVGGKTYYNSREYKEIAYTAFVSDEEIRDAVSDLYNYIGQVSRLRQWSENAYYFPVVNSLNEIRGLQSVLRNIPEEELTEITVGDTTYRCPKFYDIVYKGLDENGPKTYIAKSFSTGNLGVNDPDSDTTHTYWIEAESFDFVKANIAYITNLVADSVLTNKLLIKDNSDNVVAGLLDGSLEAFDDVKTEDLQLLDDVVLFAGLFNNAKSLKDSKFYVTKDGTTSIEGNLTAQLLSLKVSEASLSDIIIADLAWFKFENVSSATLGKNVLSPILYWNTNGETYKLDFTNIILELNTASTNVILQKVYMLTSELVGTRSYPYLNDNCSPIFNHDGIWKDNSDNSALIIGSKDYFTLVKTISMYPRPYDQSGDFAYHNAYPLYRETFYGEGGSSTGLVATLLTDVSIMLRHHIVNGVITSENEFYYYSLDAKRFITINENPLYLQTSVLYEKKAWFDRRTASDINEYPISEPNILCEFAEAFSGALDTYPYLELSIDPSGSNIIPFTIGNVDSRLL